MGKEIRREDHRVVITPDTMYVYKTFTPHEWHDYLMRVCRDIKDDVERHVDGFARHGVEIVFDNIGYCEFCGNRWTEDTDEWNGGCCVEDAKNDPDPL